MELYRIKMLAVNGNADVKHAIQAAVVKQVT